MFVFSLVFFFLFNVFSTRLGGWVIFISPQTRKNSFKTFFFESNLYNQVGWVGHLPIDRPWRLLLVLINIDKTTKCAN